MTFIKRLISLFTNFFEEYTARSAYRSLLLYDQSTKAIEVDNLSFRTIGEFVKPFINELKTGEKKLFVITNSKMLTKKENPKKLKPYAFCVTDYDLNPLSFSIYMSENVDASFSKFNHEVTEINLKQE